MTTMSSTEVMHTQKASVLNPDKGIRQMFRSVPSILANNFVASQQRLRHRSAMKGQKGIRPAGKENSSANSRFNCMTGALTRSAACRMLVMQCLYNTDTQATYLLDLSS